MSEEYMSEEYFAQFGRVDYANLEKKNKALQQELDDLRLINDKLLALNKEYKKL